MSDFSDDYPGPFAMPYLKKDQRMFHAREIAGLIAGRGDDISKLTTEIRGYITRGYIIPLGRDADDGRGALLFSVDAIFVAAALRAATDLGLAGKDKLERLALALQMWTGNPGEGAPRNPATFILLTYMQDLRPHGFSVELHASRHIDTGALALWAAVRHGDHGLIGEGAVIVPDHHMPVAAAVVPLDDLAARIVMNLNRRKAH